MAVAILLDEESGSESEQVTAGLQEPGRVTVIGTRSRGVVMDATFPFARADLLNGRDAPLLAAIDYIQRRATRRL